MNYHILEAQTLDGLMRKVNQQIALNQNWRCLGGPFAVRPGVSGPVYYYQAMENIEGSEAPILPVLQIPKPYKKKKKKHQRHVDPSPIAQVG